MTLAGQLPHPAPGRRGGPAVHRQHRHVRDLLPGAPAGGRHASTTWPRGTSARAPARRTIHAVAVKLGLTDPSGCSTAASSRASFVGARLQHRARPRCTARRRASATRSSTRTRCWPDLLDRLPVTLSLAVGAAVLWLVVGVSDRRALRAAAGHRRSTGRRWASRWPASRCRSSSPACCRCRSSATSCMAPRAGSYTPFDAEPVHVGVRPGAALGHAGVPVRGAVRAAHPGRDARDDGRGLHPHRPGQGPARTDGRASSTALRAALTPILTIFGLDLGLLLGGAILTEGTFSLPGIGKYAVDAINNNDLPKVLGVVMWARSSSCWPTSSWTSCTR